MVGRTSIQSRDEPRCGEPQQKNQTPRGQPSRETSTFAKATADKGNTGTQENLEMEGWRGRLCPARFLALMNIAQTSAARLFALTVPAAKG